LDRRDGGKPRADLLLCVRFCAASERAFQINPLRGVNAAVTMIFAAWS